MQSPFLFRVPFRVLLLTLSCFLPVTAQETDQSVQMDKLRQELARTLAEEEKAFGKLSAQTLDLDGQVKAVEELKMLKSDLDMLRQQRTGIDKGTEKALGHLDKVAAEIIQSAERVQMARTDAEVEQVMAVARAKVQKVRQEYALGLKQARLAAGKELKAINRSLRDLKEKFSKQFAEDAKIAAQYDALILELKELERRLLKSGSFSDEKEIAKIFNVIREKIRILALNVSLLARNDEPADGGQVADAAPAEPAVDDIFTTAPIEDLEFLYNLQQLKTRVAFLYCNTLTYNFTIAASAIFSLMNVIACLLLGMAVFQLLMDNRGSR